MPKLPHPLGSQCKPKILWHSCEIVTIGRRCLPTLRIVIQLTPELDDLPMPPHVEFPQIRERGGDQNAAFVMLERDGDVLATTRPVRSSDAKLRRAQALAHHSGAALRITRELISRKLAGQEGVARDKLLDSRHLFGHLGS